MERITVVKIGGNVIDNPAAMKRFLKETPNGVSFYFVDTLNIIC